MASRAATGRAVAVVLGLALAVVAAFLIWRYVDAADQRAFQGAEMVDVWVVAGDGIAAGTTVQQAFSQSLIEPDQIPVANLPDNAVTSIDDIASQAAVAALEPGTVLQGGQWSDPTLADVDFQIDEGRVGISLQVPIPEGVSGYLSQGDRVGVIAHIAAPDATTLSAVDDQGNDVETTSDPEATETRAQFVATDAEVLAIGRRVIVTDEAGNQDEEVQQTEEVLVTLSVTPEEAEKLVFANYEGVGLYLVVQPEAGDLAATDGRIFDDLFAP